MLRRGIAAVAAACLSLTAAGALSSPALAHGAHSRFLGVNYANTPNIGPDAAAMIHEARAASVRFSLPWFAVEAQENVYDWASSDITIGDLASRGIRPMPVLFGTPLWATLPAILPPPLDIHLPILTPVGGGTAFPPNATAAGTAGWVAFVTAAARRYGPGGSYWRGPYQREHPGARRPLPVRTWEVWNEPNLAYFFWPKPSAARYASLLQISHAAIAAADPSARVAMGGLTCRSDYACGEFLRELYAQPGFKGAFDVVSLHAYSPTPHGLISQVAAIRRVMRENGDRRTPIWISEFGWGSGASDSRLDAGPQGQARLLHGAVTAVLRHRRRLGVTRASWFDWQDPPKPPVPISELACAWCEHAGLLDAEGSGKPALSAFRRAARLPARR